MSPSFAAMRLQNGWDNVYSVPDVWCAHCGKLVPANQYDCLVKDGDSEDIKCECGAVVEVCLRIRYDVSTLSPNSRLIGDDL